MKTFRKLLSTVLIIALAVSLTSCYIVSGQKMRTVKGTYKLTTYTYTPQHERRDGYTPVSYDYVNGVDYLYEDYLIITGESTGYYVHKDAKGDSYIKEITLRYEYDTEDSSKVNYVVYNDSVSVNSDEGGRHRLGVAKDSFNYYKSAFDYTELITKRQMRTESISVHWEKVSRATDLSYVTELLGNLKYYDYSSFAERGIYELTSNSVSEDADKYVYYYVLIDSARDSASATIYYQLNGSNEQVKITEGYTPALLTPENDAFTFVKVSDSISEAYLGELIAARMPETAE